MKPRKSGNQTVEECGVWLDARELKRKKVEPHSISKLLSPLSRNKYNTEVALNFTQTRAPPRCIKQTIVSSFFFPKSKDKPENSPHTSTLRGVGAASPVSGKNISEGKSYTDQPELIIDGFCRDSFGCSTLVDQQEMLATIIRPVRSSSEEKDPPGTKHSNSALALNEQSYRALEQRQHFHLQDAVGIDIVACEPLSTQSTMDETPASSDSPCVPPDGLTQLDFTQDSQGNRVMSHRKSTRSPDRECGAEGGPRVVEGSSGEWVRAESEILCTENLEAKLLGPHSVRQRTINREKGLSDRKAVHSLKELNSDQDKDSFPDNKENVLGPTMLLATQKEMNLNRTSLKRPQLPLGTASFLRCSNATHGAEWMPLKRPCDQSALSLLFSQDSQGNRVISHRPTEGRSEVDFPGKRSLPLGNCTNAVSRSKGCRVSPNVKLPHSDLVSCKSLCMVESKYNNTFSPQANLLFTQDSEGNAVIKHS